MNPDGCLLEHTALAKLPIAEGVVKLREKNVPLTFEFMAYVCMAFMFPYNPDLQKLGPDITSGTNPYQGFLYHYLITHVFSVAVEKRLVPEFLNFAPFGNVESYREVKAKSEEKVEKMKAYCVNKKDSALPVPDLPDFYFRKPSELDEACKLLIAGEL
jgi:hypothetical protein